MYQLGSGEHLGEVAVGAGLYGLGHVGLVLVAGEYQHVGIGAFLAYHARGGNAVHLRQLDVHEDDIRLKLFGHGDHFGAVRGLSHYRYAFFVLKQVFYPLPEQGLIVRKKNSNVFFRNGGHSFAP